MAGGRQVGSVGVEKPTAERIRPTRRERLVDAVGGPAIDRGGRAAKVCPADRDRATEPRQHRPAPRPVSFLPPPRGRLLFAFFPKTATWFWSVATDWARP